MGVILTALAANILFSDKQKLGLCGTGRCLFPPGSVDDISPWLTAGQAGVMVAAYFLFAAFARRMIAFHRQPAAGQAAGGARSGRSCGRSS
jgi:hypothetical protein